MLTKSRVLKGAVLGVLTVLVLAANADAATTGGSNVPQNLANELTKWASLILIPTAGVVALPGVLKRDIPHIGTVALLVLLVGAFTFDAGGVQSFVTSSVSSILG